MTMEAKIAIAALAFIVVVRLLVTIFGWVREERRNSRWRNR